MPVYDVAAYRKHLDAKAPATALVGSGIYTAAYRVDSLDGASMQLSPNPTYWGGTPALTDLTVRFVPDAGARIQAVQTGEADIALYPPTASAPTLTGRDDSFYVTGEPTGPTFMLEFNQRSAPFDDPLVRRAVYAGHRLRRAGHAGHERSVHAVTGLYDETRPWAEKTQRFDAAPGEARCSTRPAGPAPATGSAPVAARRLALHGAHLPAAARQRRAGAGRAGPAADRSGSGWRSARCPDINSVVEQPTGWQAAITATGSSPTAATTSPAGQLPAHRRPEATSPGSPIRCWTT